MPSSCQTSGKAQLTVQLLEDELCCLLVCKGHIGKSIRPKKKKKQEKVCVFKRSRLEIEGLSFGAVLQWLFPKFPDCVSDLYLPFRKIAHTTHKVFAGLAFQPVILQLLLICALNTNVQLVEEECTVIMAERLTH